MYSSNQYAVIRHQHSGLVLDASQYEVTLQHFTGFPTQLWRLESAGGGKYYIVNKNNGNVMDIQGGGNIEGANIITYSRHGGENQQWFINSDKTIVSAMGNYALDINEANYSAGAAIISYSKHGGKNQQFYLQFQP